MYVFIYVCSIVPASILNGCTNFDETWYTCSSLANLKYCGGKYSLTQSLRVGWGKISKMHVTNKPIDFLGDFDETWYTCSSLADLKYCKGKYALTQSLRVGWSKVS
ncbi:hypothetical protein AVEN_47182-1 [Araneus ventricosus]|uniref:Uncharacterized protein n=1 Tax=Araneus ventricosus TaxID=182803 RepID=A0A4Y2ECV6_ARAVE|nr:hypothetical protein AVEN_47182-1 [Araneus ventricosus]